METLARLKNLTPEQAETLTPSALAALRSDIRNVKKIGYQLETATPETVDRETWPKWAKRSTAPVATVDTYGEAVEMLAAACSAEWAIGEAERRKVEAEAEKARKKTVAERIAEKAERANRPPTEAEREQAANRAKYDREQAAHRAEAEAKREAEAENRAEAKRKRSNSKAEQKRRAEQAARKQAQAQEKARKKAEAERAKTLTPTESGKKAVARMHTEAEQAETLTKDGIDIAKGATRGRRNHIQLKIERSGETATENGTEIIETRDAEKLAQAAKKGVATYNYLNNKCRLLNAYAHKRIENGILPTLERDSDKVGAEDLISEAKTALYCLERDGVDGEQKRREAMQAVGRVSGVSAKRESANEIDDCQLHENAVIYTETTGADKLPEKYIEAIRAACGDDSVTIDIVLRVFVDGEPLRNVADNVGVTYGKVQRTIAKVKTALRETLTDNRTDGRTHAAPVYTVEKITLPEWAKKAQ